MRKILLTLSLLLLFTGCSLQPNDPIQGYSSVSAPTIWKVVANKIQSVSTNWDVLVRYLYNDGIQFDITATPTTTAEGLLQWNTVDGTLDLGMSGGDIAMQIGQEMFTRVRNVTTSTLTNGSVVYQSGTFNIFPDVSLAKGDSEATSEVIGLATQDIGSMAMGYITTVGYVRGIKTDYTGTGDWGTTWVAGDVLYVSKTVAGQLTNVEPSIPHHSDIVGRVGVVNATVGTILVNIHHHRALEELSDVNGTPLTTTGQFAVWDNTNQYFDFNENIYNYLDKRGISGGQTAYGGNTTTESLTLYSNTSHDGVINLGDFLEVDEVNLGVTIGGTYADTDQDPNIPFSVIKTIDDYSGINVFNRSTGTMAQANVVVVNDSAAGYGALGINGSNFSVAEQGLYTPGSVFLESGDTNLYVGSGGTTASTGNTIIYAGGRATSTNISGYFTYDNKFGVGQAKADQDIDVNGHIAFQQISAPTNAATLAVTTGGAVDVGLHNYKFAYVVTSLGETNISAVGVGITVANTTDDSVLISNIPQSPDKRVTQIRIYRTKVASAALYYYVGVVNTGVTTYTDNATDASLGTQVWNFKENSTGGRMFLNGTVSAARFGIQNTFVGYTAGTSLTSGYDNLGLSNSSLRFLTTGQGNACFGTRSCNILTTGNLNFAGGTDALSSATTGSGGFSLGSHSAENATSFAGMTNSGYYALNSATTATGMTTYGYEVGYKPNNVLANASVTSTYLSFFGYHSGQAVPGFITNSFAIGSNAVVGGSNMGVLGGTGADAVYVGINTTTPQESLDVYGYALYQQAYGSLVEFTAGTASGSTIALTTAGSFYPWTGASSTISDVAGTNYVTAGISAGTTSTLTIGSKGAGEYQVSLSASVAIDSANQVIHCTIFRNDIQLMRATTEIKLTSVNDQKQMASAPAFIRLNANDVLDLRCANETSSGKTLTFYHATISALRVSR